MKKISIGIIANPSKQWAKEILINLINKLQKNDILFFLEKETALILELKDGRTFKEMGSLVDKYIVLGGDGTILWTFRKIYNNIKNEKLEKIKPIAGINIGNLGFLTCSGVDEIDNLINSIIKDNYLISNRTLIQGDLCRDEEILKEFSAINEVAICRNVDSRSITVESYIDDILSNKYSGDGIMLSTPTGSTAYSLSAGGPLIHPESKVFVITPICPHTLSNRPLVLNEDCTFKLKVPYQNNPFSLLVDGHHIMSISYGITLNLNKSIYTLPLIYLKGQNFYGLLNERMGWKGASI